MKRRVLTMVLTLVMALGLAVPALAYQTPDFSDLPADNWAYGPVMRMADQGIVQGTGEGKFSPEMKVSAAQFLTLVGRIVFPDTAVSAGDTWYGPYVATAQANGLLAGTQVDVKQPEAEITRYDMAVVLRAAAKKLGKTETLAQSNQVADYGDIPTRYADAVLAVYGTGLITGDQNGSFNGANTMMRNELATVIDRLVALKAPGGTTTEPTPPPEPSATTEPEKPLETEAPNEAESMHVALYVSARCAVPLKEAPSGTAGHKGVRGQFPVQIRYTEDDGKTFTVLAEGLTSDFAGDISERMQLEFDVPETMLEKGQFYVSGEVNYEGVLYATHDRRTDGHAQIVPLDVKTADRNSAVSVEIVPPATGVWRTVTLTRSYDRSDDPGNLEAQCRYYPDAEDVSPESGILLGKGTLDENGKYRIVFKVDSLNFNFDQAVYKIYIIDVDTGEVIGHGSPLANMRQLTSVHQGTIE